MRLYIRATSARMRWNGVRYNSVGSVLMNGKFYISILQGSKKLTRWPPSLIKLPLCSRYFRALTKYSLFIISVFFSFTTDASSEDNSINLHRYSLSSLQKDGEISLAAYKDKIILLSFFEPDCKWCNKQMKALNKLQQQCGHSVQPVAVGVHGKRRELKQELRKAKVSYPAFLASRELLETTGNIASTPITLVIDESGEFVAPLQGYISLTTLAEIIPNCSI